MTIAGKTAIPAATAWLLAFLCCADAVSGAALEGNPYQGIVDRNVFQLKPPPPPATNAPPPMAPPPVITLTGITTILGNKRALLKWAVVAKPGQPPKEQSYMLTEGQREDDVEVLQIDENEGTVRLRNHNQEQTLNFKDNGAKLVAAAPAVAPTALPNAVSPVALPSPTPAAQGSAVHTIPQRSLRLPSGPGAAVQANPNPGAVAGAGGGVQVNPQQQGGRPLSFEEQTLMIEAQRMAGGQGADLLPPTPISNPRVKTQ